MNFVVTNAQMKLAEKTADAQGVSFSEMMRKAGRAIADAAARLFPPGGRALILCGAGNNGGDGFAAAARLNALNIAADVLLVNGEPRTDCAREHFALMPRGLLPDGAPQYSRYECVIDCIFGTGFHGELPESVRSVLNACAEIPVRIAADVPSGVNSDTGERAEGCFEPTHTLVLAAMKRGLLVPSCLDALGDVRLVDIGIPESAFTQYSARITDRSVLGAFPVRRKCAHKGSFGRLLIIAGSLCYNGAAAMCTMAALRTGTGLCTLAVPRSALGMIAPAVPEATFLPLPENTDGFVSESALEAIAAALPNATAVAVGCGMGNSEATRIIAEYVVRNADCPVILDADGINSLAGNIIVLTERKAGCEVILTPHPLEFSRISGLSVAQIQSDRLAAAEDFARRYGVTLVLKGAGTVVAGGVSNAGSVSNAGGACSYVNLCGNAGLARGGSGDTLTGIIAALAAQGAEPFGAAACGVYCHARAADILLDRLPMQSILPRDIIAALPEVYRG